MKEGERICRDCKYRMSRIQGIFRIYNCTLVNDVICTSTTDCDGFKAKPKAIKTPEMKEKIRVGVAGGKNPRKGTQRKKSTTLVKEGE